MSTLVVEVCEVKAVYSHPNADALEFITVKGWPVIVQKALGLKPGDRVVYFPPDSVMPPELADRLGITKYLALLPRRSTARASPACGCARPGCGASPATGRSTTRSIRRGRSAGMSGTTTASPSSSRPSGRMTASPCREWRRSTATRRSRTSATSPTCSGPARRSSSRRKSTASRAASGWSARPTGAFEFMAGSHGQRRKEVDARGRPSDFWRPMTDAVRGLLQALSAGEHSVVLFGELYGSGVQDMAYGLAGGAKGFRAFDIAVDGKYLDHDAKAEVLGRHGVEMVPSLYRGPFSWDAVEEHTYGPTTMCPPDAAGRFGGREGCVVTPVEERYHAGLGDSGRVILKSISADYLARKGGTDEH